MKQSKLDYLSPVTRTLVVRFEGSILTGSIDAESSSLPSFLEDGIAEW